LTVNPDSDVSNNQMLFSHETGGSNRFTMFIESGSVKAGIYNGSNFLGRREVSINTSQKQRIVYTFDGGSTGAIYNNASSGSSNSQGLDNAGGLTTFRIGNKAGGTSDDLGGNVDEPLIANTSWSSSIVQDDYNRQPWS
jgi:hypothetical protein